MHKMRWFPLLIGFLLLMCCMVGCGGEETISDPDAAAKPDAYADKPYGFQLEKPTAGEEVAVIHTSMGDICIRFFPEAAPKAVENFKELAKGGYYENLTFHRVIKDFMIQGGDPKGDGTGGESIWGGSFEDEFNKKLLNLRGSLAMANSGANTNGSQFFINQAGPSGSTAEQLKDMVKKQNDSLYAQAEAVYDNYVDYYGEGFQADYPTPESLAEGSMAPVADKVPDEVWELYAKYGGNIHLDGASRYVGGHTVFGQVYDGMDVVDAIAAVAVDGNSKPTTAVRIIGMDIVKYEG